MLVSQSNRKLGSSASLGAGLSGVLCCGLQTGSSRTDWRLEVSMDDQDKGATPAGGPSQRLQHGGIFLCTSCHAVLADSPGLCGTHSGLQVVVFLRVTDKVILEKGLQVSEEGDLKGCAYICLRCRSCDTNVGYNLYSASRAFSSLRGLFCLHKRHVTCYMLNSRMLLPGLQFNVKPLPLSGQIEELKTTLVKLHLQIEYLSCRLSRSELTGNEDRDL